MKKSGILNAEIAGVVARLGHMDSVTIADAGLPIPKGPQRIDLVVRPGLPAFLDVVDALLAEMVVERIIIADEMADVSPAMREQLLARFPDIEVEVVTHLIFKELSRRSQAIIRTGEFTPYANVILVSGVPF
jgi:D-ribose pyranase